MNKRRNFLKKTTLGAVALTATPSFGFHILKKPVLEDEIIGHGDFTYKVVKDWAKMTVAHNPILNCHEMQMDNKGRLIMLGDHTDNNVLVFDKSGKLLDYWGTRYPGGHGLTLHDEGGEDMLYIVDCGWFIDKTGKWAKWGGHDNTDENYNLQNAHGVAVDYRDKNHPVLVITSRATNSFKFFKLDGE